VATVSRVLNDQDRGKVSATTRARVRQAIQELDYRPTQAGRALRKLASHLVGLLIPDITNAFYSAIAHSAELAFRELGYAMILCNTDEDPSLQDAYLEEMRAHLAAAVVLLGAVDTPGLRQAVDAGTLVVFLNRKAPPGLVGPFIGIDNRAAGAEVAQHFLRRGYREIGAIHGPLASSASRERFEGFCDRLAAEGVTLAPERIAAGMLTIESGYSAAERLLRGASRPRAIFCGNDLMAYGAHRRCTEVGLAVPEDVALFGFDDNPLNDWLAPWLSTVHVPYDRFGPAAAELVRDVIAGRRSAGDREVLLPFRITLRASA